MTDLQTLSPADIRANIAEEIAKAEKGEEQTEELTEEEDDDAEAEQDAPREGSEEESSEEEAQEDEEEDAVKQEEKQVPSFRLREERQRREAAEDKYNRLVAWIEEQAKGGQQKEEKKIDPLDEEAYEDLNGKLQQEVSERQLTRFEDRLEIEQVKAETKYPDFNNALDYYITFIAENIQDEREGVSKEQAQQIAKAQLSTALFRRFQNKQDIGGDYIYKRATKLGYKAAEQKKGGMNLEAIEKNKAKTEKKQSEKIRVERDDKREDYVKTLVKPGMGLDLKEFRKKLEQEMKSAS